MRVRSSLRPADGSPADSLLDLAEPIDLTSPAIWSLRRPSENPVARLIAHVLIRLLLIQSFPAHWQAAAALFPLSLLWPVVASADRSSHKEVGLLQRGLIPQTPFPRLTDGGEGGSGHGPRSRPERARLPIAVESCSPLGEDGPARLSVPGMAMPEDTAVSVKVEELSSFCRPRT